jgi:hypothetical protein
MIDPTEMYGDKFFAKRNAHYGWRGPILADSIISMYREFYGAKLESYADVGCAVGDTVKAFQDKGIEAWGFEASESARPYVVCKNWEVADLRIPFNPALMGVHPDVVTCFEVLEHLEEETADFAVRNLCGMSDVIVTSACPPHPTRAATKYHLNEQHLPYWDEKFALQGYQRHKEIERFLRATWNPWRKKYGIAAWHMNLLVYTLGGA